MSILKGRSGSVTKNSVAIAQVKDWKIDTSVDIKDATCLGDTSKVKSTDLQDWKGTCTLLWDPAVTEHGALQTAMLAGNTLTDMKFYIDNTHYYSGSVIISSLGITVPVGDYITCAVAFEGSGVLSYA